MLCILTCNGNKDQLRIIWSFKRIKADLSGHSHSRQFEGQANVFPSRVFTMRSFCYNLSPRLLIRAYFIVLNSHCKVATAPSTAWRCCEEEVDESNSVNLLLNNSTQER